MKKCCKCKNKQEDKQPDYYYYDRNPRVTSMRRFIKEQYALWLAEQRSKPQQKKDDGEWNYRFKFGDVSPKQAWQTYSKYIEDNACRYPVWPNFHGRMTSVSSLDTSNIRTVQKFGTTWRV